MAARRKPERGSPAALRNEKGDALDWSRFHFLENLLVFCAQTSRRVPAESGVRFGISSDVSRDAVCLLFQIDRPTDPLLSANEVKPDYLVVHLSPSGCICTIVEMKGVDAKKAEHALDQITNLWTRLKKERDTHVSPPLRKHVHFQAVILTPSNVQVAQRKLEKVLNAGLPVALLAHHQTFELASYVGKRITQKERYAHVKGSAKHDGLNLIEASIIHGALPDRVAREWGSYVPDGKPPNHVGVCVDVAPPPDDSGLTDDHHVVRLILGPKKPKIVYPKVATKFGVALERAMTKLQLPTNGLFVALDA